MSVLCAAAAGAVAASLTACIPGLHVYNIIAVVVSCSGCLGLPADTLAALAVGMITGYAILNSIPAIILAAPDESMLFAVSPGQKYLLAGKGREAVMLTGLGGMAGLLFLLTVGLAAAPRVLPAVLLVLRPHQHWILWCVIVFMILSEWPRQGRLKGPGARGLLYAWLPLLAGILTFVLSALIGFVLIYRPVGNVGSAYQNLAPGFIGLFTLPWLIMNIAVKSRIPVQSKKAVVRPRDLWKGMTAGIMGGGFAAFFPVVTGGVGGFLAGHASAIRNDRDFLVSQGASRLVYYVGSILLFFVPGLHIARGGGAWLLGSVYEAWAWDHYFIAAASIAVAGAVSLLLLSPLTGAACRLAEQCGIRAISIAALCIIVLVLLGATGIEGVLVAAASTGTGLLPAVFGTRRMNCLGVVLLPLACEMSGYGDAVARLLGL